MPSMAAALPAPSRGLRGWVRSLSPRDRAIYAVLLGMLGIILVIYAVGAYLFLSRDGQTDVLAGAATFTPTQQPASPTPSPSATTQPTLSPSASATVTPVTPSPSATLPPLVAPSATFALPATELPTETTLVVLPTETEPAATLTQVVLPTSTSVLPTNTTAPTSTSAPPTATATSAPPDVSPTPSPLPTEPPVYPASAVTLYFSDPSRRVLVPVLRSVETNQWRTTALNQLFTAPPAGLISPVPDGTQLVSLKIEGDLATVNLSRSPGSDESLAAQAILLVVTERSDISRVQLQVQGSNLYLKYRPNVNQDDQKPGANDFASTSFLPLYFPLASNGSYQVRVIRLIAKTTSLATATVNGLLSGPGPYSGVLSQPIPAGTILQEINIKGGTAFLDFNAAFADSPDRGGAVNTLALALATYDTIDRIEITVNGQDLAELWPGFDGPFGPPVLNPA